MSANKYVMRAYDLAEPERPVPSQEIEVIEWSLEEALEFYLKIEPIFRKKGFRLTVDRGIISGNGRMFDVLALASPYVEIEKRAADVVRELLAQFGGTRLSRWNPGCAMCLYLGNSKVLDISFYQRG